MYWHQSGLTYSSEPFPTTGQKNVCGAVSEIRMLEYNNVFNYSRLFIEIQEKEKGGKKHTPFAFGWFPPAHGKVTEHLWCSSISWMLSESRTTEKNSQNRWNDSTGAMIKPGQTLTDSPSLSPIKHTHTHKKNIRVCTEKLFLS